MIQISLFYLKVREAASPTAESIKSGDFGRGVSKSLQKSTRSAQKLVGDLREFADIDKLRNSLRRFSARQPSVYDEHWQQKIIHPTLEPQQTIALQLVSEEDYSDVTKDYDNFTKNRKCYRQQNEHISKIQVWRKVIGIFFLTTKLLLFFLIS